MKQVIKCAFDIRAADRLALHLAALLVANVIWMPLARLGFRIAGRHRLTATRASNNTAKRKVFAQIWTVWRAFAASNAVLNGGIGLK
ncbi:MAG: hypothetical protein CMK07_09410 [Ponticaulis sp.]|nr:hypothetical protein [Ponticaulis sp.]